MDEKDFEKIIASAIKIGAITTLKELGLMEESVTERQANKMYGKRIVAEWRHKRWVVGYATGNKTLCKFTYKRSELETASRMTDIYNIIPPSFLNRKENQIEQDRAKIKEIQNQIKVKQ